jgi:Ca-activated chloride channel family protein
VKFLWPSLLWGLLLVPLAVVAYVGLHRRRVRQATRFGNPALWPNLLPRNPGVKRHVPAALLLLALTALLLGLARPQMVREVDREEGTVVLAVDTSASMLATDIQPTRFAAARKAADLLISDLPERYQLGVVTFSGKAVTRTLPTTNRAEVRAALDSAIPSGGTAIGDAIRRSLEAGGIRTLENGSALAPDPNTTPSPQEQERAPLAVLLLSDGYSTEGVAPLEAAGVAQQAKVPVFTVAVGTQDGLGPDGAPAPPDEATLRRVAELTGAQFFTAPTSEQLQAVYANLGTKLGKTEELRELTAGALAIALLMFVAAGALSLIWFSRFP